MIVAMAAAELHDSRLLLLLLLIHPATECPRQSVPCFESRSQFLLPLSPLHFTSCLLAFPPSLLRNRVIGLQGKAMAERTGQRKRGRSQRVSETDAALARSVGGQMQEREESRRVERERDDLQRKGGTGRERQKENDCHE